MTKFWITYTSNLCSSPNKDTRVHLLINYQGSGTLAPKGVEHTESDRIERSFIQPYDPVSAILCSR